MTNVFFLRQFSTCTPTVRFAAEFMKAASPAVHGEAIQDAL
jgi:hypothetical protein